MPFFFGPKIYNFGHAVTERHLEHSKATIEGSWPLGLNRTDQLWPLKREVLTERSNQTAAVWTLHRLVNTKSSGQSHTLQSHIILI